MPLATEDTTAASGASAVYVICVCDLIHFDFGSSELPTADVELSVSDRIFSDHQKAYSRILEWIAY